ncbi:MAG: response regulator transcription factor [Cyclobacteriaceae bacterium]|nr:response regulator transcription factor [Cyclobacteriaceae bacterium]
MRVLIADDHAIVRKGLIELLKEEFPLLNVTEASNGVQALAEINKKIWDIILLDISMPGQNGIEVLKQMRAMGIKAPILMLSMHPEETFAIRALKAGASGFLNKDRTPEELTSAIQLVLAGRKYVTPKIAEQLADLMDPSMQPLYNRLSDREIQVLQLIASGMQVSDIAEEISLSVNTISTYRTRILEKLALKNNAEITRYAFDNNLV